MEEKIPINQTIQETDVSSSGDGTGEISSYAQFMPHV